MVMIDLIVMSQRSLVLLSCEMFRRWLLELLAHAARLPVNELRFPSVDGDEDVDSCPHDHLKVLPFAPAFYSSHDFSF